MNDLSTLLRDHVDRTEPALPPTPCLAVDLGRRRLRVRRATVTAVLSAVVIATGALAMPRVIGPDAAGSRDGIDPATTRALATYDAQAMPTILVQHASARLERAAGTLPSAEFRADDDQGRLLQLPAYDEASAMSVRYDAPGHQWRVWLGHARSEAEGDARANCASMADFYVSCAVSRAPTGDVVVTTVGAVRSEGQPPGTAEPSWRAVSAARLGSVDPAKLWFMRSVEVVHSETFLTNVSEVVRAADPTTADRLFETPASDMVTLATDPELVIPPPR